MTQIFCHYPISMGILDDKFFHLKKKCYLLNSAQLFLSLPARMFMQDYAKATGQIYRKILPKQGPIPIDPKINT